MRSRAARSALAAGLVLMLLAGAGVVVRAATRHDRTHLVAYFDNSNGIFAGDDVVILGVPVGRIDRIEPQPQRVKITFWVDDKYRVPADVDAVILSPKLITSRAIQLTPVYTGGQVLAEGAVIPQNRTAVPVEFDDLRAQLQKLTESLQPTTPGGVNPLGAAINTAAENLRGQGANIRDSLLKLSQAASALGDHSNDIFSTVKNLSTLVSALHDSADLLRQLNTNLASVTALLANEPDEVGRAVADLNMAVGEVKVFIADNRETIGTTSDKLASVTKILVESMDDLKQLLHIVPTVVANSNNIYDPVSGGLNGVLTYNVANPISFVCGAIQAASRLNYAQSAKLCVQYLAPIMKNRFYNMLPLGEAFVVGAQARPNEITYSEDWLRPDRQPPHGGPAGPPGAGGPASAAEGVPVPTNPADGLPGIMVPPGGSQ